MWIAKLKLKHDCIIGNRCEKFKVTSQAVDVKEYKRKGAWLNATLHQLVGKEKDIKRLVEDLRKDKYAHYVELNKQTLFLIESYPNKMVSQYTKQDIFLIKPCVMDDRGMEHWEIASHKKQGLMRFIKKIEGLADFFELLSLKNTALQNIYFPKVMPELTDLQKEALELAIKEGYYEVPKKTSLRKLAKLSGVALATYQKHLQKAESKVIPDTLFLLK